PLFLNSTLSQLTLSIVFFALGFFTSTQVISYPLVAESNSAENTGAATGIASVIIMGGCGVGQVLFGCLISHHTGGAVTSSYNFFIFITSQIILLLNHQVDQLVYLLNRSYLFTV